MKRYTTVSSSSDSGSHVKDNDTVSVASRHSRFTAKQRINSELSEPLTNTDGESFGGGSSDPYFVFRSDLQEQLELVDEFLAEYLRTVHEIVRTCIPFTNECLPMFLVFNWEVVF
jgi:hypothetical protein